MNKFKRLIAFVRISLLKRKANRIARRTGVQQFVVCLNGTACILGKDTFKRLRATGVFPKTYTATHLRQIAFFATPNKYQLNSINYGQKKQHISA